MANLTDTIRSVDSRGRVYVVDVFEHEGQQVRLHRSVSQGWTPERIAAFVEREVARNG